eukprot:gene8449-11283_t
MPVSGFVTGSLMDLPIFPAVNWLPPVVSACMAALAFVLLAHGLRKMRSSDLVTTLSWWAAAAVTAGGGLWAAQMLALSGLDLPWANAYRPLHLGLACLGGVLGSAVLLSSARLPWSDEAGAILQALLLCGLWAGEWTLGVMSLGVQPARLGWADASTVAALGLVFSASLL